MYTTHARRETKMLTIRPIAAHELDGFARFSRDDELNAALKGEVSTLWEQGSSRLHISYVGLLALSPRLTKGVAAMAEKIDRREDVNPREGLREYGDVDFADPVNKKYILDKDRYARGEWLAGVSDNTVTLSVPKDQLIEEGV